jgi:predicted HAD superfamily phosphohydrolase YqeG
MEFVSIFVNPISKIEPAKAKFRRKIERKIVKHYNKRGILIIGDYYE